MLNYVDWFLFSLSTISIIFMIVAVLSSSIINVLLCAVIIVLIQSMMLIKVKIVVVASLIMIIYFGAIVILFSFMILFLGQINSQRGVRNYKPFIVTVLVILWSYIEIIQKMVKGNNESTDNLKREVELGFSTTESQIELNLEEYSLLSEIIYGQLISILVLMTLVLGIVLVLILLMINSPNKNNIVK